MNILVFSWRDPKHPLAGGAEQVMHEHMKGWAEAGHNVTLLSSAMKGLKSKEEIDGVQVVRRGYQYLGVQVVGFIYYLRNKNKFDLVVDQFHGVPFFTPLYVRKPRLAVIQEPTREVWLKNPLVFPINLIIGIIGYIFEPAVFLFYKNTPFMTGSESAKKEVSGLGVPTKNITVVPHGLIGSDSKVVAKKSKEKTITHLGVLSKDKGIEDSLRAFSILSKKGNYNFWVLGKTDTKSYSNKLSRLTARLGLKDKVKYWGFVNQSKKYELLSRSHVLINPSIREGWGLVNIEANSVGTPVVAYNSPGLVDSVKEGESGFVVKNNSPESLADKIESLLAGNKMYDKLSKSSVAWSNNFDWVKSRKLSNKLISSIGNE